MAEKFVRSTRGVRDISKLSTNLIEETDIVSTEDGKLFIKGKNEYIEVGGNAEIPTDPRIDEILKDVTSLKETSKSNTDTISTLQSELQSNKETINTLNTTIEELQTQNTSLDERLQALETSQDTPTE